MTEIPGRLQIGRFLVVVSFLWPFINAKYFFPSATVEVDFFLVFLAAGLVPEALFDDKGSLALTTLVVAIAIVLGSLDAGLRVVIGVIPLLFVMGLYRHFANRGWELIPRSLAYRALQAFVGFSLLQYIDLYGFAVIPRWLTDALTVIVPRYTTTAYDEFGIRGVQGWASEPSGAAMTCFAFAAMAIMQEPRKRWRVLALFAILALFNKSVYAIALLLLIGLALLIETRNKMFALSALVPLAGAFAYFLLHSGRVAELRTNLLLFGLSESSNRELARIAQILYPLMSFPKIYRPTVLFSDIKMEPLGLLPLLVGYGSLAGCLLYYRVVIRRLRVTGAQSITLALTAVFMLSFLVPPDFVPAVVAFAYATAPTRGHQRSRAASREGWFARLGRLVFESAAARRREGAATQI